jgi:hypothetical protein
MCQHQYFLEYVLGIPSSAGKSAEIGTALHKIAECLGKGKLHYQNTQEIKCDIGDEYIGEFIVDDIFSNSYITRLSKHVYEYYSAISQNDWSEKDIITLVSLTNELISFQDGSFDPRKRQIFNIEQFFDITIKDDWAKFNYNVNGEKIEGNLSVKGTIDLIEVVDDKTIEVCDYKTGKKPYDWALGKDKTLDDFKTDPQLLLYFWALKNLYPEKDVIFTVYYIQTGQPFTVCFDKSDYDKAETLIKNKFREIQNNEKPELISPTRKDRQFNFKCKTLCHYCKNNQPGTNISICEFFQNELENEHIDDVTAKYANLKKISNYQDGGGRKADKE